MYFLTYVIVFFMLSRVVATLSQLSQVKVKENGESLVALPKKLIYEPINHDMLPFTGEDVFVRQSVRDKILAADRHLKEKDQNLSLRVAYGYRHPSIQRAYFEAMKEKLATEDLEKIHQLIAEPSVAGHPTGGAIDATCFYKEKEVDMGGKLYDFDHADKIPTFSPVVTKEQMANRMLLHDALVAEKFAPFYGEWWHFCYGDKEWAVLYKERHALYSALFFKGPTCTNGETPQSVHLP